MINRLSNTMYWLVLVMVLVVVGCEQKCKEEMLVYEMFTDPNFVMPDYASGAIEATGGRRAWTKAEEIEFDCVVTFYNPDGSFYLTERRYEICPWSYSIRISAATDACQLPRDDFPELILNIVTAPVLFLDKSLEFTRGSGAVRIEGLWYYPIERTNLYPPGAPPEPYWSNVVFYQDRDNSLVDMIRFAAADEEKFLIVRGYDYYELEKGGVLVPTRIEIFRTDPEGVLQQRLVKIVINL